MTCLKLLVLYAKTTNSDVTRFLEFSLIFNRGKHIEKK